MEDLDAKKYRRALSSFATGVGVVTTVDNNGEKAGITINSFNSVSLDPPLVLWSIGNDSQCFEIFTAAEYFAVNVLAKYQVDLCDRFALSSSDKFDGLECDSGLKGVPILHDCCSSFVCQTEHLYDGGDHKIIVGRVLQFTDHEVDPLIFYRGHFLE